MAELDDEMDDIEMDFCQNMKNGKCLLGESCKKFHPIQEVHDDDENNE